MKKSSLPLKIHDHLGPQTYRTRQHSAPHAAEFYADPSPRKPRRRISYIPREVPPPVDDTPPPLLVRGLLGGSVNVDLRGLNVSLSKEAFAHWVADEALQLLHIHRGDIAIIDRTHHILREGNLILVELDGDAVLRRLRRRHKIWWLEAADGSKREPVALTTQPLQGAVVGVLRLFTKLKPVRYSKERISLNQHAGRRHDNLLAATGTHRQKRGMEKSTVRDGASSRQRALALAAEEVSMYRSPLRGKAGR